MRRLIIADRLIDAVHAAPIAHGAILIDGERILDCGRATDIGRPEGAELIDATGMTVMPGLIDAHVHLAYSGTPHKALFRSEHAEMSYPAVSLRAAAYARETLRHGFTAVRDMHAPGGTIIDLRDAIDAGHVEGPRIRACGRGLSVTGGHMDQPGWADHTSFRDLTHPCDGPDGFRRGVREEIKRGADFIKLNTNAAIHGRPDRFCRLEMAEDEIKAACDEAHEQGLKVASHTLGEQPLAATIVNGVDCVEHAHFTDDRIIELMVRQGTFLVPTLLVNERNFDFTPEAQGISQRHWEWLLASREAKWATLAKARAAGVRIGCGTDAGFMIPHGSMSWREIALLAEGGLTPLEAITAATATNAELLDLDAGRLEKGRLADILIVAGNPLDDLSLLGNPANLRVIKGGRDIRP
ncbi:MULTISPECIES: amidohydrolase family protein [unclassified Chelatococcus]|uniref:metal-dependent hydrolase family protein n=1 Tax=unclassified Chelatococcus TaxID=2638111 RepID=UPI001BCBC5AC|nr:MULTISPECIES: amidohydrolase family protein [unclassified Chelatococcus]CAH1654683.1 Amidohydrolase [Hyphomicrobiales bacterium]MBS7742755.1 amidohydrolase family protein [Chelatococcus sp. HY11]MBX3542127.1 amidohydrolase family protein [Chelatococcus sp.]MCO5075658.1 amidohydrolase family protein [Chelatococcus sp.]CAH1695014.1 Amidohydrolase [Hyphomicrobiales bacterium]